MKVASAKERLLQLIKPKAAQLSLLSPADGVAVMLAFYQGERADGCEIEDDGDMLLYQWGCYDSGQGDSFDFNVTRQFIDGAGDDEGILQLSLTFKFEPTDSIRALGDGNRWCHSPDEVAEFRSFIDLSAAYKAVASLKPAAVVLDMQSAG